VIFWTLSLFPAAVTIWAVEDRKQYPESEVREYSDKGAGDAGSSEKNV
jgi:hypothetical protein